MLIVGDVGAGCTTRWLVTDQVGTPRILADATGTLAGISRHDYLPFGEELTAGYGGRTNPQGYTGDCVRDKFVGYERDAETGLDYAEARYYGSSYGRFTSVDPAMGSARKSMPQSWNRYTYVMNQPLSLIDPTGEYWVVKNHEEPFQPKRGSHPNEYKEWIAKGYAIYEDGSTLYVSHATGRFSDYHKERINLGEDGKIRIVRSNVGDKIGALAFGGAVVLPVALLVAPVAIPEVALGGAAGGAAGGGASLASRILLEVILEAALMQEGDRSPKKDEDSPFIYRGGSDTINNLTPKEKDRTSGVSTFDTIERAARPGDNYQIIDPRKLVELEAINDNPMTGHYAIRPRNPALMDEWISSRESGTPHRLSIELKNAIVGSDKRPK